MASSVNSISLRNFAAVKVNRVVKRRITSFIKKDYDFKSEDLNRNLFIIKIYGDFTRYIDMLALLAERIIGVTLPEATHRHH